MTPLLLSMLALAAAVDLPPRETVNSTVSVYRGLDFAVNEDGPIRV